jgi:hypothetical protein
VLQIIEREHIDIDKWNALVSSTAGNSCFSLSVYLDAVAENWCIVSNDNYSCGIAVPYSKRLGIKCFTTPIFVRYLEWFGHQDNWVTAKEIIEQHFSGGSMQVPKILLNDTNLRYYQTIEVDRKLSTQAKRMLSKSKHLTIEEAHNSEYNAVFDIISSELPGKISTLNKNNIAVLKNLVKCLSNQNIVKSLVIRNGNELVAGIILIEFNGVLLYLKGASFEEYKKLGAMYALMNRAIEYAQENKLVFDFGGSSAEGVRRFNLNLGGTDNEYGIFLSDTAPIWFKELKRIKKLWIKK